jgi:hypothetical protein
MALLAFEFMALIALIVVVLLALSGHFIDLAKAIGDTTAMAVSLEMADFLVVRMKVEAVMWDKRRIDGEWKEIQ